MYLFVGKLKFSTFHHTSYEVYKWLIYISCCSISCYNDHCDSLFLRPSDATDELFSAEQIKEFSKNL